ncbi:MAG: hypothetical protein RJA36_1720 [Pseudomonadota bacterium]|jgi:hypothetical protein
MKVLNLGCAQSHVFEGWFGSESDFQGQLERGLLECPMCGDKTVRKLPSAPRLNLSGQSDSAPAPAPVAAGTADPRAGELQAEYLRALREVMARTEDVGERFASEARRMHHGEVEPRQIRGRASVAEAVELIEEGIGVLPLPDLPAVKDTLQ